MSDNIPQPSAADVTRSRVAVRLGITDRAVNVLAENGVLPRLGIDAKTIRALTDSDEQPQSNIQPPIVSDEPAFDEEFDRRFDRLVAFGSGCTRAERVAIAKVWNGRVKLDAAKVQQILQDAGLSN